MTVRRIILVVELLALAGCAAHEPPRPAQPAAPAPKMLVRVSGPSTAPASDPKSRLSLEQIEPRVSFATTNPATAPSQPPVEAVRLYAQARIAVLEGRRYAAGQLLEKAIALDPGSFELHKALADVYASGSDPRALREWESAAEIEPDRLDTQIQLGRQYIVQGEFDSALQHLWMALATTDYKQDHPSSGEADFLLARVLQQQGYDRASLQLYERLLSRLTHPQPALRHNPQLMTLLLHPESLAIRIASLYEKHGEYAPALKLLNGVAERAPLDFDLHARIVHDRAATGDKPGAVRSATALVARFHGERRSLDLLRELTGSDAASIEALQRLRHDDPDNRQVLYALVDLLAAQHRPQADRLIEEGLRRWPDDLPLLRRQVDQLRAGGRLADAARLVISALARRPDRELELAPLWDALIRPSQFGWLRMRDVQGLSVSGDLEPARLVLLARAAGVWHRDGLQRESLARAVEARPQFPPALRDLLALVWSDPSLSEAQKEQSGSKLIASAQQAGDAALAAELRAQMLLDRKQATQAALAFADAVKAGDRSPELYLNFAAALHAAGDDDGAQSVLWKLIGDRPFCQEAYVELHDVYQSRKDTAEAGRVLATWLTADPDSVAARRAQARDAFAARRFSTAEQILLDLFEHHSDDPGVLSALQQFFSQTDRLGEFTAKLERRLAGEPWNLTLATVLAETYADRGQTHEATRVTDQMRHQAAQDPDLLYRVAGLYSRIGNTSQADQVLQNVLSVDPTYAGASNDLGYSWAEQGKNLDDAEALVRRAVTAEPDNASFLDSMGWVLYKRGKFADALEILKKAAGSEARADPVVLDHLGDTLYQLGDRDQAARRWHQAVTRLPAVGDDDNESKQLRTRLLKKQQQFTAGQTVNVAPVAAQR